MEFLLLLVTPSRRAHGTSGGENCYGKARFFRGIAGGAKPGPVIDALGLQNKSLGPVRMIR
jgi:hypothetical protein